MERLGSREITPPEDRFISDQTDFSAKGRGLEKKFQEQQLDRESHLHDLAGQWDRLLSFFGTEKARQNFLRLCEEYNEEVNKIKRLETAERGGGKTTPYNSEKAAIHNEIMNILRRLHTAKASKGEDQELLMALQERDVVEALIPRVIDRKRNEGMDEEENE